MLVACHWARNVRAKYESPAHIHSQSASFSTIAMYGAWLLDASFQLHWPRHGLVRDRCALEDKIRRAEFIVCISEFHRDFYLKHGARQEQLFVAYCGIDPEWFYPRQVVEVAGSRPYRIVSSGRLVEKKGFSYLVEACRILADRGEALECIIGGSGELEAELKARVIELGLGDKVTVTAKTLVQEKIIEFMHGGGLRVALRMGGR